LLPGSAAIGEEGAAKKPQILDLLEDSEPLWLIDPVDGTHNFAHGDPRFAVMMALVMGRETVAGWIYEPLRDSMAIAEKGGGAWLDGKKMTVADTRSKKRLNGYAGWSGRKKIQKYLGSEFSTLTSLRCVGIEYRNIANGDADFAVYSRLKPWDHAPGELLFREAGGMSAMQIGKAPYRPHLYGNNGMVLATDRRLISKLKSAMAGHA
ncbi:MAG: inositol monophosphatase family protein, partial [Magnetospiraceae bacterium]